MTAEVAIMNKWAIALAADSAVTIKTAAGIKIYNTNKLFMLSKYEPIGVMIYGNAQLMEIPWETIIKMYRRERLQERTFVSLEEYATDFITFLDNNTRLFSAEVQENDVYQKTYLGFFDIKSLIDESVEEAIHKGTKISSAQIKKMELV